MSVSNNKVQLERDKMKDEILRKYSIPILRVCTNESGEEFTIYYPSYNSHKPLRYLHWNINIHIYYKKTKIPY